MATADQEDLSTTMEATKDHAAEPGPSSTAAATTTVVGPVPDNDSHSTSNTPSLEDAYSESSKPGDEALTAPQQPETTTETSPSQNDNDKITAASISIAEAKRRYPTEATTILQDTFIIPKDSMTMHPGNVRYRAMVQQLATLYDPSSSEQSRKQLVEESFARCGSVFVAAHKDRKSNPSTLVYTPLSWNESIRRVQKSLHNRRRKYVEPLVSRELSGLLEDGQQQQQPEATRNQSHHHEDEEKSTESDSDSTASQKNHDHEENAEEPSVSAGTVEDMEIPTTEVETMAGDTAADTMADDTVAAEDNDNDDEEEEPHPRKKRKKKGRSKLLTKSKKTKLVTEPLSMPDAEGLKVGDRIGVYWVDPHNVYYTGRISEIGTATNPPRKLFYIHYDDTTFEWVDLSAQKFIRMPVAQFPARSYCVPDVHRIVAKYNLYDDFDDTVHALPDPEVLVKDGWGDDLPFETLFWHIKGKSVLKAARTLQYKLSQCLQDTKSSMPSLPSFANESVLKSLERHKINRSAVRSTLMVLGMLLECDHAVEFSETITMIASSMKIHEEDKAIQLYGIMCLFNLLGKGDAVATQIVASGSINATIRAMERFDSCEDIQQTSCWFLREASNVDATVAKNIAGEKGLTAVVQTVERFTGQVKEDAALALMCITQGMLKP